MLWPRCINFGYASMTGADAALLFRNALALAAGRRTADTTWRDATEELMTSLTGAARSFAFPSARAGLLACLGAMGVGPGDEVLVTGFTCVAVPAPIVYRGAKPVYVDIDPASFNMDLAKIEQHISPRTKAIVVQHTFGNPADMDAIGRIARAHGLYVLEDCALAVGSAYDGKPVGLRGHAAIVSFEFSKTVTAGWGGVAWVNDRALAGRLLDIQRHCRMLPRSASAVRSLQVALSYLFYHPNFFVIGRPLTEVLYRTGAFRTSARPEESRGRMPADYFDHLSDAHWRVIHGQLKRLDRIVAQSRRVAARYQDVLDARACRTFATVLPNAAPAWSRFPFLVANREGMRRHFRRRLVSVGQWFSDPIGGAAAPEVFGYIAGMCPVAEFVSRHVVNLSVSVRLTADDEARVVDTLASYLDRHPENREFAASVSQVAAAPSYAGAR